jgi:hypothetical protein
MKITDIQLGYARFTSAGTVAWKTCRIPRNVIIAALAVIIGIAAGTLLQFLGIPAFHFVLTLVLYSIIAYMVGATVGAMIVSVKGLWHGQTA